MCVSNQGEMDRSSQPLLLFFSLLYCCCFVKEKWEQEGIRTSYLDMLSIFFFSCLVKMGEFNIKFLVEVLFLGPVSLRHPGGKWKDENCTLGLSRDTRAENIPLILAQKRLLLNRYSFSSGTSKLYVCVCLFSVGQYCCHILSVRGMLAVACLFCLWPSFSPLEAILKEMLPHSGERACSFKHVCQSVFIFVLVSSY